MRKTSVNAVGLAVYNLSTNTGVYPHVFFTMRSLGTNPEIIPNLYRVTAQFYAQYFGDFNRLSVWFITILHRPNNDCNKGE